LTLSKYADIQPDADRVQSADRTPLPRMRRTS